MIDYRKEIGSRDDFRKVMATLYRRPLLRKHGTLITVMAYPRIEVGQIPLIPLHRKRLVDFRLSHPEKLGEGFYRASITLGSKSETFFLETGIEGIWLFHFISDKPLQSTITYRFVKLSYPYLMRASLKSTELIDVLGKLEEKYGKRPTITQLIARQYFDSTSPTATYRQRTLILYQEDAEATMNVLQEGFPLFPDTLRIAVDNMKETLYTAHISRNGTLRLFGGPKATYYFDDIMEFVAEPSVKRLTKFRERAPRKESGLYVSKPLEIVVGPSLHHGLKALRESLLKSYYCVTYHAGNPYLDMAVIDTTSASEFRILGSGESIVVMPTKYEQPSALLRLTRSIMETVGGEEQEYEQAQPFTS